MKWCGSPWICDAKSVSGVHLSIGHTGIVRSILKSDPALTPAIQDAVVAALSDKDPAGLAVAAAPLSAKTVEALSGLCLIYGGDDALDRVLALCKGVPDAEKAVDELRWIAEQFAALTTSRLTAPR